MRFKWLFIVGVLLAFAALFTITPRIVTLATTPEPTEEAGMEMNMDYNTNDYAPLAMGMYEGQQVFFVHTEASDPSVAQLLTDMMGPEVVAVPSLAEIPAELLGNVYVFTNGIEGMGPLGFQPDVFDTVPGEETYTPLRAINLVAWEEGATPVELTSAADILAAAEAGDLTIQQPGVVVNMPILVWGEEHR